MRWWMNQLKLGGVKFMEDLIRCQRCWEWLPKKKGISVVSNMRWTAGVEVNDIKLPTMGMDINYFCPQCISIIEMNSQ